MKNKMENKLILILIINLYSLASCQNNENNDNKSSVKEININVDEKKTVNLSEFIRDYKYIKLETNEKCIIGSIDKVEIKSDKIYILDTYKSKSLYVFNINGNFLYKIGQIGNGPGEFISPGDFSIKDNLIYLLDVEQKKMINYNIDGRYIKETYSKIHFRNFQILNNDTFVIGNTYISQNDNKYNFNLIVTDKNFNPIYKEIPFKKFQGVYNLSPIYTLKKSGQFINFFHAFNDVLYEVHANKIQPKYHLNFGKELWPNELFFKETFKDDFFSFIKKLEQKFVCYPEIIESPNYIFLSFKYKGQILQGFYSKKTSKLICSSVFKDDISCGDIGTPNSIFENDIFISVIEPYKLLDKKSDKLSKLNINENDNPIIMLIELKPF